MRWTTPTYHEITGAKAATIRARLRHQAYHDRECWCCLTPLRDRTSTYCSTTCREEMGDAGAVDWPGALVIVLHRLIPAEVLHHAA
jgi:hypothetical protein